jgi:hypothetical protein
MMKCFSCFWSMFQLFFIMISKHCMKQTLMLRWIFSDSLMLVSMLRWDETFWLMLR